MTTYFKLSLLYAISLSLFYACNVSGEKQLTNANSDTIIEEAEKTPECIDIEQIIHDTILFNSKRIYVNIRRYPDTSLPLLADGYGNYYYDNAVELTLCSTNDTLYYELLTKEKFKELISVNEYTSEPLWGMNFNKEKSDGTQLCFSAQIGWGGDGPAFFYLLNPKNWTSQIAQDISVQDINYNSNIDNTRY